MRSVKTQRPTGTSPQTLTRATTVNLDQRGFSLLEVIVAVAVFALIAAAGYAGLDQLSRAAAAQRDAADILERLHLSMALFEQDTGQIISRPVTGANGRSFNPITGDNTRLELTRGGWANPLNLPRSHLKRVEWRYTGDSLQRWLWPVLDRTTSNSPQLDSELEDIRDFRLRFLDSFGAWHEQWPPANQPNQELNLFLPQAVEITFHRGSNYRVRRLIETGAGR